jgi:hypothetical protein
MALAHHYSGDKQVRKVAKYNIKKVARSSRPVLQAIAKADHPGKVVMTALESIHTPA